jgi:hypothetical protein
MANKLETGGSQAASAITAVDQVLILVLILKKDSQVVLQEWYLTLKKLQRKQMRQ